MSYIQEAMECCLDKVTDLIGNTVGVQVAPTKCDVLLLVLVLVIQLCAYIITSATAVLTPRMQRGHTKPS